MAFISRDGQITATADLRDPMLGALLGGSGAVRLLGEGAGSISYRGLYRNQPWVFVCVNAVSRGMARMPLKTYERSGEDRRRMREEDGGFADLMAEPFEGHSSFDLIENIVHEYLVDERGTALAWLDRAQPGAPPRQIVPLDGLQWRRLRRRVPGGGIGATIAYEWRQDPGSEPTYLLPSDVVSYGFSSRTSPLQPLATALQIEDAAQRSTRAFYENGAKPSGVFTTEGTLGDGEAERIEAMIKDGHVGPDKRFRVAVLGNVPGAKWNAFEATSEDAQTVEHRKLNREEVVACFDVPQPQAGILDRATFSNIEAQDRMWLVHTLGVHAVMLEERTRVQLVRREPAFRIGSKGGQVFTEFDFGEILRGTPAQRAEAYQKLIQGIFTPNEIRKLENLAPIQDRWADAIYVPSNLTPVGAPGPLPRSPSETGTATGGGAARGRTLADLESLVGELTCPVE